MARVLLGITGSVAAIKTPLLYQMLANSGHDIRVIATHRSLHFFNPDNIGAINNPLFKSGVFFTDKDEWKGGGPNNTYQRGDRILHIELARWAEVLVVAPLDANSLSKFAIGLTDGCLHSLWRAWDWKNPVILAPAMNTSMWNHPATRRHILAIAEDSGLFSDLSKANHNILDLINEINSFDKKLKVLQPVCKMLACGDEGIGAMAEIETIIQEINKILSLD